MFPYVGMAGLEPARRKTHVPHTCLYTKFQHIPIMSDSYPFRSPLISVGQTKHLPSMLRVGFEPTRVNSVAPEL